MTRWARGLALLALLATPAAHGQRPGWQPFTRAFDAYATGDSVVGASVLMMRDGRVLAHHEYGFADRALGRRVDERTIFHWGSITKTLTAVAVMQLRDRKRLSLDDRVTQYIPELRQVHDPFGSMDDVTIRMLLSHSAGFQNPTWPYKAGKSWEPFEPTRWEQLAAMLPYQEVAFAPGSRYSYSNPGFIYLARIIEQLTGDPYQSYVYKNLWAPLGITHSYFGATPYHLADQRSNNYDVVRDSAGHEAVVANGRDFDPGITIPNGGWNAPLGDLARWVGFLSGAAGNDTVLARTTLDEMWRTLFATEGDAPGDSVGLSFFVLWRDGVRFIGHTGQQAGFRSFFYVNPKTSAAVIAAFNTTNDARDAESAQGFKRIIDAALELIAR
ncbi:MAG: serine hydrolase [Gemmatimonadetes bacterium]|nr:MAG: serine hydrolase [Gemmatimonadota bacterium]